ncbi:MAG: hypothetical protein DWB56_14790 [Candidatus Jettenia sp.]|uniref:Uncharacterized protein n=1 Tax=Candidatus Jettenia caeni TaxID=247490 RepID=I3ILS9_9BACT|nr:hypothetical protein [Candidatus Jettenia sp. AMX1]KAA0243589.1 MAG: hypothetical protein EDM70_10055 [Candidatus Brocadia sp. AMX2]MBC6930199.1 hypothetical protein [Candidatus Jettenia sp.]GAB62674.1 hypothetical protein KSU1_C1078 [Candidatus Jettenia caeni]MCQ3927073.1 hypothetical protein [Candidatus Jettenia sp.]MDL1939902.1 hypothetical protein [Candidatus Jettenia sp. AMX1]
MFGIEISAASFLAGLAVGGFFAGVVIFVYFLCAYRELDAAYQAQILEWLQRRDAGGNKTP